MAVKPLWNSPPQFVDANGDPYSGALLFFYAAGSSTKQNTYTDSGGGTPCSNPITLNAAGYPEVSGTIVAPFGTVGQTYKIGLAAPGASDPPATFIWTEDNVAPINDTSITVSEWVSGPTPTYVSATSLTLVGDQTSVFHVGRRIKTTNSGGTIYSRISVSAFTTLTTLTVVNDSGVLDAGLSAISYGVVGAVNTSSPAILQTVINAKGDLVAGTASDAVDRVAVGANEQLLVADSAQSTGMKWRYPTIVVNAKTGTYTLDATDAGKLITCSGTFTLNVTAAATLGSGWWCWIKNISTGTITVDPNASETILIPGGSNAGETTITLPYSGSTIGPYNVAGILLWCNGTGFEVLATDEAHGSQAFTAGGTWTAPAGVTTAWLTGTAGGGGGGGQNADATAGGTTSVGALVSLTGGAVGAAAAAASAGGAGGAGDINGASGGYGFAIATIHGGGIGGGGVGAPGSATETNVNGNSAPANSGFGGSGGISAATTACGGGGQGGRCEKKRVSVVPGTGYTVTIGTAGSGGTGTPTGGNGGTGLMVIDW